MDTITHQIVQQVSALPIAKKKALFELLKQEHAPAKNPLNAGQESWTTQLLSTSVWTDAEIDVLHEARQFINQWQPKPF